MHIESLVVASGRPPHIDAAPLTTPIVLSATFFHAANGNHYLRDSGSDTTRAFEEAVGALEGGTAVAFSSGMAATGAVIAGLPAGTIAVTPMHSYSGTSQIFAAQQRLGRLTVREVDMTDTAAVVAALDGAGLLWVETPANPLMGVADLPALIAAAHDVGAQVCVDSTFNTPLILRPLTYGADIVMHSATKYLSGHSDVLMGVLVANSADFSSELNDRRRLSGAIPGALESFLALRGIRTLALRMERAQANAAELAQRLDSHAAVSRVRYAGLPNDPFHERAARIHQGFGAMISFEVDGSADDAERVCESVRLIAHATSLGGVESLIERRARHAVDAARGTPPNLLRLSVGIENVEDLWDDLASALEKVPSQHA